MSDVDRELDAAWRAASREQPPATLDATIRAAARRAVGAGPARARHVRSWPLAAAAAVAVIAFGIVLLIPPEHVAPTLVADNAPVPGAAKEDAGKLVAPAPSSVAESARPAAEPAAAAVTADRAANVARKQLAPAPAATPSGGGVALEEKRAALQQEPAPANVNRMVAAAPERDSAPKSKVEAAAAAKTPAPTGRAEPFPAAPVESRIAANAPAAAPPSPPAAPTAASDSGAATPPPAAVAKPSSPQVAGTLAARSDEAQVAAQPALAKVNADRERAKDAAPRPADEWIKLIRRLKSEGRNDEATKELAAFRAAYKERADALLPADLRATKP